MQTEKNIENHSRHPLPAGTIIVIGRQFGSGGRRIGRLVAEKTGFRYYDKELLAKAAESLGFSQKLFDKHDERKPSTLHTLLQGIYGIADNFHDTSIFGESLYQAQSRVIKGICKDEGCVIVGRTADYIMRHHPGLVSVFLHAPIELRAADIVKRGDAADKASAMELAKRRDRERESYYNFYTGREWGKASNYHLTIDASGIQEDMAADLIIGFARIRLMPSFRKELTT